MQISIKLDSLKTCFCVVVKLNNVHENTLKKKHVTSSQVKITNFHLLNIQLCLHRSRKMSLVHNSFFLFSELKIILSYLATYPRVLAVYWLSLIVIMIATKPRDSQRPTIYSHLLGCSPSLAKLRKATEYSSLFFPNKISFNQLTSNTFQRLICFDLLPK